MASAGPVAGPAAGIGGPVPAKKPLGGKRIDAKMAAAKRKARESKERSKNDGWSPYLSYLGATLAVLAVFLYRSCVPEHRPLVPENITATRIDLGNGRHLAVHETGSSADSAKYHVLVLHDLKGCRLSMLPNITTDYLVSKGIRLVSYDRPGYGQSDPNPARTVLTEAEDIKLAADKLKLPGKFYVLSLGLGSYVAWSLLKVIPERIESVAMVSPWTSFRMESLKSDELIAAWHAMPRSGRVPHLAARLGPWGVSAWYTATKKFGDVSNAELPAWLASSEPVPHWLDEHLPHWALETARSTFAVVGLGKKEEHVGSPEDSGKSNLAVLQSEHFKQMEQEALLQGSAESEFRDLASVSAHWGFDLSGLASPESKFTGTVHAWIGTEDSVMPPVLVQYVKRVVPDLMMHMVPGGSHYFVYESGDWSKMILSGLLGLPKADEALAQEAEASSKVYA